MIAGHVIGQIWATRKSAGLSGARLLLVAVAGSQRVVVAQDILDARTGDRVLVSWGSGARNVLRPGPNNRDLLCDAAISQIVDGSTGDEPAKEGA